MSGGRTPAGADGGSAAYGREGAEQDQGQQRGAADGGTQGMHHVAYEMRDFMHLKEMLDHLATMEIRMAWGPGRHGVGHNIFTYHPDPDGNFVELFTELDVIADEETGVFEPRPWHEEWPQGPKFWVPEPAAANKWGWINPEMMVH